MSMIPRVLLGSMMLFTVPALAQTTPPPAQPGTSAAAPAGSGAPAMGGLTMADSATLAIKFVNVRPADVMTSKLIGINVYNNQNENLGEIADLAIENGKTLSGVVVSVGGFLGLGERYVVLDPSTVSVSNKDGKMTAHVDTTKDNLKSAPEFKYKKN